MTPSHPVIIERNPARLRIGIAVLAGLVLLLAIVTLVRPEMSGMTMAMHRIIVGFGL